MPATPQRRTRLLAAGSALGAALAAWALHARLALDTAARPAPPVTAPAAPAAAPVRSRAPIPATRRERDPSRRAEPQAEEQAAARAAEQAPSARGSAPAAPRVDRDSAEFAACVRELSRLRPLPGASDAENLRAIERRREWEELAQSLRSARGNPPPPSAAQSRERCPEPLLRALYDEARNNDLRALERHRQR